MEVCFTKDELSVLSKKAKKAGLSIGGFVRRSVADKEIKEAPPADIPFNTRVRVTFQYSKKGISYLRSAEVI